MAGNQKDKDSQYFEIQGNAKKPYTITINYKKGNWCTCRGMISMKGSYGEGAGRTQGTSCKHVKEIIREEFGNDWGTKDSPGSDSRTPAVTFPSHDAVKGPIPAPTQPSGRRAAVMATRAKIALEVTKALPEGSLLDRIADLEAAR